MKRIIGIIMVVGLMSLCNATAGLVSHWTLDGNLNDSTGSDNGTFSGSGSEYVTGHNGSGQALHITNFTTRVDIGIGAAGFNPGQGDFTFTGWFKMSSAAAAKARYEAINGSGSADYVYLKLIENAAHNVGGIITYFGRYGSGAAQPSFNVKGLDANKYTLNSTMYDDDTWHWMACRVASSNMTLWIDGVNVGNSIDNVYGTNTTMTDSGTRDTFFGGGHDDFYMDDFRVWDEALTEKELKRDYAGYPNVWLESWGRDDYHQVSDTPVGSNVIAIAACRFHSVALNRDGSILAWGSNNNGESTPPSGTGYTAVGAGSLHSLALKADTSIAVWGDDNSGTNEYHYLRPTGTGFIAIAGGGRQWSVALTNDGSLVAWGYDNYHGNITGLPAGTGFTKIAAGYAHGLALDSNGYITTWGDGYAGCQDAPTDSGYIAISGGSSWSMALKSDGSIVAWGNDSLGQVSNVPTGTDFVAIAAGHEFGMALKSDGSIVAWGDDDNGQVSDIPTGSNFVAIAAGWDHGLALADITPPQGTVIVIK